MSTLPLRIFFLCTGVEIYNRGIESFFREAYDGLREPLATVGVEALLLKGGGRSIPERGETRVWCLPRTGRTAALAGMLIGRNAYVVEQLTFLPGLIRAIKRERPAVIYYSDTNVAMRLANWRGRRFGLPGDFRLLYSNGAPMPPPLTLPEHIQQVAPRFFDEAIGAGESPERQSLVPYGIAVPDGAPLGADPAARLAARRELGLPTDRVIVISVGAIGTKTHKRMPYTVDEVARLPKDRRPFLLLLGALEEGTEQLRQTMIQELGHDGFAIRSVPYEQVRRHYQAADCFVLGSLKEGFGRVYLEALIEGLPCIVHDGPVMRYVLGDQGTYADLSQDGAMATALADTLNRPNTPEDAVRRREAVRQRFSWQTLAPAYADMFKRAAGITLRHARIA